MNYMFRTIDERLNTLNRDRENIKNTQTELIDMKTIMSEIFLKTCHKWYIRYCGREDW